MGWIARKMDNLGSAACGGVGGICLSQAPAFTQAYLQRLGGHIDEARRTVLQVESGLMLPRLGAEDRAEAVTELGARVTELEQARSALTDAHPLLQPLLMTRYADIEIARRAYETFTPALPLDVASLTWTGIGVVLALLVYELLKSPALLVRRKPGPDRHYRGS